MSDETIKKNKSGAFSFGLVVFSMTILIPLALILVYGFHEINEHQIKMKCIEQSKTYVNGMCLQMTPINK